jgi:hypothetical protein
MKNFETLVVFKSNNRVIHINLDGITHKESLDSPDKGGNCINWILGHIIASRNDVFEILKADKLSDDKFLSLYKRGTRNVIPEKAFRIENLIEKLDSTLNILEEKIPEVDLSDNEENLKMLAFLSFHEAYHCGQIGILRRIIGKEGAIK